MEAAAPPCPAFTAMFYSSKHANHGIPRLPRLRFVQTKSLSRLQQNMVGAPELEVAQGIGAALKSPPKPGDCQWELCCTHRCMLGRG